ncbi:MAG: hypothetical protein DPW15_11880 [Chloroflexi bacterium]|nr:hypothetical protein [Chloroflexota bacterium]
MKNNHKLGAALAILGIVTGLLAFYLIASQYNLLIASKTADGRLDEATSVRITYAVLGWLGTATTAIWAAALYGFAHKEKWAWFWGAVAATIQLLAGFFPAIPAMDSHMSAPTLSVFALGGVLWFSILFIGGVDRKIIMFTFIAGLAYVLTFIDGVAPIAKYTQQVSWWGAAAWAMFIFATLSKKSWAIPVGLFAGTMSMMAGYPLGLHNALFEVHRFSMFLPAPLLSTALIVYLILPSTRKMLEAWNTSV